MRSGSLMARSCKSARAPAAVSARTKQIEGDCPRFCRRPAACESSGWAGWTSGLVVTTSCYCPDWRDLDGKAKVLDAADEAKDLLAFRTAIEVVGAEVLVQSAVL